METIEHTVRDSSMHRQAFQSEAFINPMVFFFLVGNSEALEINSRGPAGSDGHAFLSSLTLTSVSDGQRKLTHPDLRLRRTEKSFLVTVEIQAGAIAFAKVN